MAIGDRSVWICLKEDGGWAYSSGLPNNLHKLLHTRATSHPSPLYVALGTEGRYYIRFANGKSEWVGPEGMTTLLNQETRKVRSVAFGSDWSTYFVAFEDGWWSYSGSIPLGLQRKIEARGNTADLEKVSLGPNDEWALFARNGRIWWDGGRDFLDEAANVKNDLTDIEFGPDHSYFIRHTS